MKTVEEKAKVVPVYGEYEVAVVGGGVAGIAAALAAARTGAKTVLLEKQFVLGGLATLGLVTVYLPLCDGNGRQVSFGIAEELLRLSIKHGYECGEKAIEAWLGEQTEKTAELRKKHRYTVRFNAHNFAILAERALIDAGVEILYGTSFCDALVEDGKVKTLFVENKSGRRAICVKSVVDASGDADVFARAGAKTRNFEQGNLLAAWYYCLENGKMNLRALGYADIPDKDKTERNAPPALVNKRFKGLDGKELSEMTVLSHEQVWKDFLSKGETTNDYAICTTTGTPQVRMTRAPIGKYVLDDTDEGKRFEDSVGLISNWKKAGPVYEVPFSCLYGADLDNVISAGRCVSNTDAMWNILRVIPCCAVTGQAAGTAAAMSDDFSKLRVSDLQRKLKNDGVVLHIDEL